MGADWRALTWWEYSVLLAEWNDRHDPDSGKGGPRDIETLKRLTGGVH